ncbi:MAG: Protein containing Heat shock protein Hsp20 protein [Parcubacteria group bacterium GW2011_GWA2_43_11]|nr:MAG: Protein containing Heat shock protein Hsp20 protein [Parcubacteria group bacterium GW2011_GWA2_43_11]
MPKQKKSFFQRLTGAVDIDDGYDDAYEEEAPVRQTSDTRSRGGSATDLRDGREEWLEEEVAEGQLTVDVYQTPDEIVIRSIVAGVRPDDLDISISRDMVTIRGSREEHKEVTEDNYFHKELYWGSFSRTVLLPAEVEVEDASAQEKHGLLTIRLPKIDKEKQTKLKVKTG